MKKKGSNEKKRKQTWYFRLWRWLRRTRNWTMTLGLVIALISLSLAIFGLGRDDVEEVFEGAIPRISEKVTSALKADSSFSSEGLQVPDQPRSNDLPAPPDFLDLYPNAPTYIKRMIEEGDRATAQNDHLTMDSIFSALILMYPDVAEFLTKRAQVSITNGRWSSAITYLTKADSLVPHCPLIMTNLAFAYLHSGQVVHAERLYLEILALNPDELTKLVVHLSLGRLYSDLKRQSEARSHLIPLVPLVMRLKTEILPFLYINIGASYGEEDSIAKSIEYYDLALKVDSGNIPVLHNMGLTYALAGELDSAIFYWEKVLSLDERQSPTRHLLGKAYGQKGDTNRARYHIQLLMAMDPDFLVNEYFPDLDR